VEEMRTIKSIMMIDDDMEDQDFFREALRAVDPSIKCMQCASGKLALSILLSDYQPDYIFVDLNMPVMSGFEFLMEIKTHEHLRNIPIVVYTTSSDDHDREKTLQLGASSFITKPTSMKAIKAKLEAELRIDYTL
jgi:CheY-like chemotaxis protein